MSEYMERFNVSKLVGAPPGYVGYDEGGDLTERVRRNPFAVVLFDEIEKAHPDIFHILLQILDEGTLTDSIGRKVDFRNAVIIMTSNLGSKGLESGGYGFGRSDEPDDEKNKAELMGKVKQLFNPEFLNRLDDTIIFNALRKDRIIFLPPSKNLGYALYLRLTANDRVKTPLGGQSGNVTAEVIEGGRGRFLGFTAGG